MTSHVTAVTYHVTFRPVILKTSRIRRRFEMAINFIGEYFWVILPLVILEFSLKGFCLWKLFKEGPENLSKGLWALIILVVNFFGPILFLSLGRRRDLY
jgi:hypothetical protein